MQTFEREREIGMRQTSFETNVKISHKLRDKRIRSLAKEVIVFICLQKVLLDSPKYITTLSLANVQILNTSYKVERGCDETESVGSIIELASKLLSLAVYLLFLSVR